MDRVDTDTDITTLKDKLPVDHRAAVLDFPPERATSGGRDAEGFLDAGTEVGARVQFWAKADGREGGEGGLDFGREAIVDGRAAGEIVEESRHGGGGCIGACGVGCVSRLGFGT